MIPITIREIDKENELYQVTWIILSAIKELKTGKYKLAAFLKGSKAKTIMPISTEQIYGGLFWYSISTIIEFINQLERIGCIHKKMIQYYPHDFPILELTDAGQLVLEKKEKISLQVIKKEPTIGNSEKETLHLIKGGIAIPEIAQKRGLATSTINTHIYRLILNGELSSKDMLSKETIDQITAAAQKLKEKQKENEQQPQLPARQYLMRITATAIKEILPEASYDEIRWVLGEMRREENGKNNPD